MSRPGQPLLHVARAGLTPAQILTAIAFTLDVADVVVADGKVATFNNGGGAPITQATAAQRASYSASDSDFGGKPSALFESDTTGAVSWNEYPLPSITGFTAAEAFLVLKSTYGAAAPVYRSGLWTLAHNNVHYPNGGEGIFDGFLNSSRPNFPASAGVNLALPHIYNTWNSSAGLNAAINGASVFSTGTNGFTTGSGTRAFGTSFNSIRFNGKLAYMVVCSQVQTPEARAAMNSYLAQRYGVTI